MSHRPTLIVLACSLCGACASAGTGTSSDSESTTVGATGGTTVNTDGTSEPTGTSAGSSNGTSGTTTTTTTTGATSSTTGTGDSGGSTGGMGDTRTDDFERPELGPNWRIVFPTPPNDTQVQIVDDSDLGMGPGPQGFFLVNWIGSTFQPDQYCEATISPDVTDGWIYQVYVRWRESDAARYGFGYNGDPGQDTFGQWIFKYDGVPSPQTRIIASTPAATPPAPGDVLRLEVEGYTLRGYHNGNLVLEATDTDPSRIDAGEVGLAARWATGNMGTPNAVKIWEDWAGGSL